MPSGTTAIPAGELSFASGKTRTMVPLGSTCATASPVNSLTQKLPSGATAMHRGRATSLSGQLA